MSGEGSVNKARVGLDEVSSPTELMSYPPLAYLLNSVLGVFNFLRECPLTTAREALLGELSVVLQDCCKFLLSAATEVKARGVKYLSKSTSLASAFGGDRTKASSGPSSATTPVPAPAPGGAGDRSLDRMYARAVCFELIPHILACFEHVYPPTSSLTAPTAPAGTTGSTGTSTAAPRARPTGLTITRLADARGRLGADVYTVLEKCCDILEQGGMLVPTAAAPALEREGTSLKKPSSASASTSSVSPRQGLNAAKPTPSTKPGNESETKPLPTVEKTVTEDWIHSECHFETFKKPAEVSGLEMWINHP